ncbi:uncharacterized protein LOC111887489 [Lactuca sativa]|uniref:uncharacterized protein LOC111887489 n=1 Tax=Lactuca sativa TaxID=4236 RepID=UPI000CD908C1|nr:uncharacterized protein LOC111887489 [Lactuca sativa]
MRSQQRNPHAFKPSHISQEVGNSWQAKWNTDEFKLKSEHNNKNKCNGLDDRITQPTYNTGSTNHLKIASDLNTKLGHDPPHSELFLYTRTKNHDGVTFANEKDRQIHEEYTEKRKEMEAEGAEFEDDKIFCDVGGGHDKKKTTLWIRLFCKDSSQD